MINKQEVAAIIRSYLPDANDDVLQRLTENTVQEAVLWIYTAARLMSARERLQRAEK